MAAAVAAWDQPPDTFTCDAGRLRAVHARIYQHTQRVNSMQPQLDVRRMEGDMAIHRRRAESMRRTRQLNQENNVLTKEQKQENVRLVEKLWSVMRDSEARQKQLQTPREKNVGPQTQGSLSGNLRKNRQRQIESENETLVARLMKTAPVMTTKQELISRYQVHEEIVARRSRIKRSRDIDFNKPPPPPPRRPKALPALQANSASGSPSRGQGAEECARRGARTARGPRDDVTKERKQTTSVGPPKPGLASAGASNANPPSRPSSTPQGSRTPVLVPPPAATPDKELPAAAEEEPTGLAPSSRAASKTATRPPSSRECGLTGGASLEEPSGPEPPAARSRSASKPATPASKGLPSRPASKPVTPASGGLQGEAATEEPSGPEPSAGCSRPASKPATPASRALLGEEQTGPELEEDRSRTASKPTRPGAKGLPSRPASKPATPASRGLPGEATTEDGLKSSIPIEHPPAGQEADFEEDDPYEQDDDPFEKDDDPFEESADDGDDDEERRDAKSEFEEEEEKEEEEEQRQGHAQEPTAELRESKREERPPTGASPARPSQEQEEARDGSSEFEDDASHDEHRALASRSPSPPPPGAQMSLESADPNGSASRSASPFEHSEEAPGAGSQAASRSPSPFENSAEEARQQQPGTGPNEGDDEGQESEYDDDEFDDDEEAEEAQPGQTNDFEGESEAVNNEEKADFEEDKRKERAGFDEDDGFESASDIGGKKESGDEFESDSDAG